MLTEAVPTSVEFEAAEKQMEPVPSTSTTEGKMAVENIVKNLFDIKNFEPLYEMDEEE